MHVDRPAHRVAAHPGYEEQTRQLSSNNWYAQGRRESNVQVRGQPATLRSAMLPGDAPTACLCPQQAIYPRRRQDRVWSVPCKNAPQGLAVMHAALAPRVGVTIGTSAPQEGERVYSR